MCERTKPPPSDMHRRGKFHVTPGSLEEGPSLPDSFFVHWEDTSLLEIEMLSKFPRVLVCWIKISARGGGGTHL